MRGIFLYIRYSPTESKWVDGHRPWSLWSSRGDLGMHFLSFEEAEKAARGYAQTTTQRPVYFGDEKLA